MSQRRRVLILGAAGRDFHDFNTVFRDDPSVEVVAFTATQIPDIAGRRYPPELAGPGYPEGIPIRDEAEMEAIIEAESVDEVVFSYSDVKHETVMHLAARASAAGAGFRLLGADATMLESSKPVIAVTAVRTGCGKSQTSRHVAAVLKAMGKRVAVVRHPMPYGDLAKQAVQRFEDEEDLFEQNCTIEEREEYEPHLEAGHLVFAGVDYAGILDAAEDEADVVLWDGGNNDLPFYRPDLWIVIADPHRPGHEARYWPGETNVRAADVVLINKIDSADESGIDEVMRKLRELNPMAEVVMAASPLFVEDPAAIRGKRVLVIEDGPTLTHGGMAYGAGSLAAKRYGAAEIVDPRPYAVASIADTYAKYPSTGPVLPAMGYGESQVRDLEATIRKVPCDLVIIGTPIDLRRLVDFPQPAQRVRYELDVVGEPTLEAIIRAKLT